jgi:4-amino-4-deoxy-L-arabinose transferase-like glycosyltransferase
MLHVMLFRTEWELGVPALIAVVASALWIAAPRLRRSPALRVALIVSALLIAAEVVLVFIAALALKSF